MAKLPILHHPDPRLRTVAASVAQFDAKLQTMAKDMIETMYAEDGIGLAGTQVNFHQRLIVIDISESRDQPIIFVNPKITPCDDSELAEYKEGCLSVPDFSEIIDRPNHVLVDYQDTSGNLHNIDAHGLLAVCVQHECDHLQGKLFIDYLSVLKRNRITNKLKKRSKQSSSA